MDPSVNVRYSKCADGKNELFAEEGKGRGSRMKPSAPVIDELTTDFTALGKLHGPTTASFLRQYQPWMRIWITFSTKCSVSI